LDLEFLSHGSVKKKSCNYPFFFNPGKKQVNKSFIRSQHFVWIHESSKTIQKQTVTIYHSFNIHIVRPNTKNKVRSLFACLKGHSHVSPYLSISPSLSSPIRLLLYLPLAVCLSLPASQKTPLFSVLYPGHPTPFLNTQVVHSLSSSSSPWSARLIVELFSSPLALVWLQRCITAECADGLCWRHLKLMCYLWLDKQTWCFTHAVTLRCLSLTALQI